VAGSGAPTGGCAPDVGVLVVGGGRAVVSVGGAGVPGCSTSHLLWPCGPPVVSLAHAGDIATLTEISVAAATTTALFTGTLLNGWSAGTCA
jgi:hypothetical protein